MDVVGWRILLDNIPDLDNINIQLWQNGSTVD
jgi:hypothetical protein